MNPNKFITSLNDHLRLLAGDFCDEFEPHANSGRYLGRDGKRGDTYPNEARDRREAMESSDRY